LPIHLINESFHYLHICTFIPLQPRKHSPTHLINESFLLSYHISYFITSICTFSLPPTQPNNHSPTYLISESFSLLSSIYVFSLPSLQLLNHLPTHLISDSFSLPPLYLLFYYNHIWTFIILYSTMQLLTY